MLNPQFRSRNPSQNQEERPEPQGVRIDGYQQVLDMLRAADHAFRESLLRRMAQQNPALVKTLREALRT